MEPKVIVAWDGSGPARAALSWALHRQGSRPGTVRLVQVVDDYAFRRDFTDLGAAVSKAQTTLSAETERIRLIAPAISFETEVVLGEAERELKRLSTPGSLLVVGTRAWTENSARYWSLGSRLAPSTQGALAIVPEHVSEGRAGVLVGVNGSEHSMSAALVAAREAVARGDELQAVLAWNEPTTGTDLTSLDPEFVAWLKGANQNLLDDSLGPVERKFPELRIVRHLENDSAVRALRRHATTAALLVVGTRGYGPVRRVLLGSVSHTLILNAEYPIMVVGEPFSPGADHAQHADSKEAS